jgi:hypothetical protein
MDGMVGWKKKLRTPPQSLTYILKGEERDPGASYLERPLGGVHWEGVELDTWKTETWECQICLSWHHGNGRMCKHNI